jgi:hypothetical protein
MDSNLEVQVEQFFKRLSRRFEDLLEDFTARLRTAAATPRHADAKHNPLGSARAFLDAGRRGDFPTFKRGREVVALWADVESYIERRCRPVQAPAMAVEDDRALLEKLRPGRGRRKN